VKASIVTNNRRAPGGLFVLHAKALPDNPYDGHTLRDVLDRTETLTGCPIERAHLATRRLLHYRHRCLLL
jgi:IS5 family transposase